MPNNSVTLKLSRVGIVVPTLPFLGYFKLSYSSIVRKTGVVIKPPPKA
jgi:hypothetical protein